MTLTGRAMLINFMNVEPDGEDDFNRWYDTEHLEERVRIPGFRDAQRYVADEAPEKYLGLYLVDDLTVFRSEAYVHRLANQTEWSHRNFARFRNATRACARIEKAEGAGLGGHLALVRLRPGEDAEEAFAAAVERAAAESGACEGVIGVRVLASDPQLSIPIGASEPTEGSSDWYVVIDGVDAQAMGEAISAFRASPQAPNADRVVSVGTYRLLWSLHADRLATE